VQGGTAEAHDASVIAAGAFEQTVRGPRRLIEMGQRVKINAVLTRHLLDSLAPFAQLMIDLRPEEVGLDTVKPGGAFATERGSYRELVPALGPYATALRDAVLAMDRAGILVRLTSFPPCLVPGAEHLVSEEDPRTLTHQTNDRSVQKLAWKRGMQVKPARCVACAYDATCGGVYAPYAELHGLDELRPLARRAEPSPATSATGDDAPLTRALRAFFVRSEPGAVGVRAVRRLADGSHELDCFGPGGEVCLAVAPRGEHPAYATTARFAVAYRRDPRGGEPDLRVVDAVVRALRRIEARLPGA
jgi:hypothetical protein